MGAAAVPVFDALYLDMNGIIHNCTHGNDPSTKLTETEMILRIFNYLDKLVQIVKPQQLLFMAIDGAHMPHSREHTLCLCSYRTWKQSLSQSRYR